MKKISDCTCPCCLCYLNGNCPAGYGDIDFVEASKETLIKRLDNNQYPLDREFMISYLKNQFKYLYVEKEN